LSKAKEESKQFTESFNFDYSTANVTSQDFKAPVQPGQTITPFFRKKIQNVIIPYICGLENNEGFFETNFDYYSVNYYKSIDSYSDSNKEIYNVNIIPIIDKVDEEFTPIDSNILYGTFWDMKVSVLMIK